MALEFAGHNCRLVLWDLNSNGNEETARMARTTGATVKTYQVDVSDRDLVYSTASQVRKTKEQVLSTASQVRKTKEQLYSTASQVRKTKEQLYSTTSQVRKTKEQLYSTTSQVRKSKEQLYSTTSQIRKTKKQVSHSEDVPTRWTCPTGIRYTLPSSR